MAAVSGSSPLDQAVHRVVRAVGRIGVRLLVVNLLVLLVPVVGLEFARIHERQLLDGLERDMKNQTALVRAQVETDLERGIAIGDPRHVEVLTVAARSTRTRVRLLDEKGNVAADSHENGPPEGPERPAPHIFSRMRSESGARSLIPASDPITWPEIPKRSEVKAALAGNVGVYTRLRERDPGVFLFVAEPITRPLAAPDGPPPLQDRDAASKDEAKAPDAIKVVGVVYTVRSTQPVMVELYRIRAGLVRVLVVAICFAAMLTIILAVSISRPLGRLSRAAKRVARGERDVQIPVGGGGEIAELGESFAAMTARLDARLRYIEGFAADVAHEFKSPLTSIRGAAELLEEGAADDPDARRRFLRNIELDVARLDRLVSRLLELSRVEASNEAMGLVDLRALLERLTDRASTPDQPVVLRYEAASVFLRGRETDLERALINLLDNAVRFSPAGVAVEVVVTENASKVEGLLQIAVTDHGAGITPANLPKIFDRFFTTDADRDGTGLGLAIVQAVVTAHGGTVGASSTPGEGATFTVVLPSRR